MDLNTIKGTIQSVSSVVSYIAETAPKVIEGIKKTSKALSEGTSILKRIGTWIADKAGTMSSTSYKNFTEFCDGAASFFNSISVKDTETKQTAIINREVSKVA